MGGEEHPRAPGASEEAAEILGLAAPGQSWGAGLALLLSRGCLAQLQSLGWTSPPPDSPRGHLICCVLEPVVCLGPPGVSLGSAPGAVVLSPRRRGSPG